MDRHTTKILIIIMIQAGGSHFARPQFGYLPSHSYIPAHMHVIRYYKQGCETADLVYMKSSKERVKGTDYVNSMSLYSIICGACTLISSCLGHVI